MQLQWKAISRSLFTAGAALLLPLAASQAFAATCNGTCPTATGTLAVSATVQSSITLNFTNGSYALSSGSGTNTASLAFGNISAYGYTPPTGITFTAPSSSGGNYSVSASVNVNVNMGNDSGCTITVQGTDTKFTYTANGTTIPTSNSSGDITSGNCAGGTNPVTIGLTVPGSFVSSQPSNSITFTAIAK